MLSMWAVLFPMPPSVASAKRNSLGLNIAHAIAHPFSLRIQDTISVAYALPVITGLWLVC